MTALNQTQANGASGAVSTAAASGASAAFGAAPASGVAAASTTVAASTPAAAVVERPLTHFRSMPLSIKVNGEIVGPTDVPAGLMMIDYLHEYLHLTGSRLGCGGASATRAW